MNWFIKGRSSSTEFFSDEVAIPAGGKRVIPIKLHFTKDLNKLIAQKKFTSRPIKGTIPPMVHHLNLQEDRSYKMRTVKAEAPADKAFFDIHLKQQFKESWRAVAIPANLPIDKIAVFQLKNGAPAFDRPVGYCINGRELLLKVPGFHPEGGPWRSTLKNGILTENIGSGRAYAASDFDCRIFYNRTDGLKLKEKAPAGGELIPNGTFDTPDAANPAIPAHHGFVANPNHKTVYLKKGGAGDSPCLKGGGCTFNMIPEAGRTYKFSFMVKNEGGENMTRCWLFFLDAEGKRIMSKSTMLFSSKKSFDWQKVEKSVFIPEDAAMMQFSVSRTAKKPGRVLLDNVSVKVLPITLTRISPLEQGRKELKEQWGVPIDYLEKLSLEVENPHKKWYVPAEKKPYFLYLPFEHERGRLLHDKRIVVELAQRMPMELKVLPVLGKIISSTGIYGVNKAFFAKELSSYTAESLKALPGVPKVVLITSMNPKLFGDDLKKCFAEWQKKGTHFVVLSGDFFPQLSGKVVKAPAKFMLPEMKKVSRNRAFTWHKKGNSYIVTVTPTGELNPLIPKDQENNSARRRVAYIGRDYPWWEYQNLTKLQIIRYLANIGQDTTFVSGSEKEIVIKAGSAVSVSLELEYRNMFREVKVRKVLPLTLKAGVNNIALPAVSLPSGRCVADARLLDSKGNVLDGGAFVIDRPETVKVALKFKNADAIFPQGKNLEFSVALQNLPANARFETEIEDTFGRIIARNSCPAKAAQEFSIALPAPRTILNNLIYRVKDSKGILLAEGIREFSSPAGPSDFTEFFAMTWGLQRYLSRYLELDGVTANSPYKDYTQLIYRTARTENLAASPMGLASFRNSLPYRSDRKSDPVRNPCFHDPAYLAKNKELLYQHYGKRNLLGYYDIRDYWSGDEQFLGSTVCFSPHCLKEFRKVLKEKYKTIEALNKVWESSFESFDKVVPCQLDELKSRENLAPWLDHKLFMAATFAWGQFRSHLVDLVKFNPHARMGASGTQSPGYSYDWVQYMKHCQVMSYYSGIQTKLIHDLGGKNILAGRWMTYCYADTDQEPYCVSPLWTGLLRGSNMGAIWPPTMTNGDGTPTQNARFVKPVFDELRSGITKMWLSGESKPEIALLYSQSSLYTAMGTFGGAEWTNSQNSWVKILDDMKYDCRYLSYEAVAEKGIPAQYKVVILPVAVSLSEAEIRHLEAFVKRGGVLISDYAPGRFDGHGKRRTAAVSGLFTPFKGGLDIAYQELPQFGGKFKVAEKGRPFMERKVFGKGYTVNLNVSLSDYFFIQLGGVGGELATTASADAKLQLAIRKLVRAELKRAGVSPTMEVLDSKGNDLPAMALLRWDGGTGTAALFKAPALSRIRGVVPPAPQRIDRTKGHLVTVKLPVKGHLYDTRNGKYLGFSDSFKSFLVPGIANFCSIQKTKVSGVTVKAPATAAAGSVVKAEFSADGATGIQIINAKLFDPAGKNLPIYRKNIRCEGGKGSHDFQIPFNAPKGKWQLQITHVNTGLKKVHTIEVK